MPFWLTVLVSATVSVVVCVSGVVIANFLERIKRTAAKVDALLASGPLADLFYNEHRALAHKAADPEDKASWMEYQRKVLQPAINALELLAAGATPTVFVASAVYSKHTIRLMCGAAIVGIWERQLVQDFVRAKRDQADGDPSIYAGCARLANWLKAHPLPK